MGLRGFCYAGKVQEHVHVLKRILALAHALALFLNCNLVSMKALIQRVSTASVKIDGKTVGEIKHGLLVFLGVKNGDTEKDAEYLAGKIANLRVFEGSGGHFDKSIIDEGKEVLVISQFTLYGSTKKGRRPDFSEAANPDYAENLYDYFVHKMRETGIKTETGKFQEMMDVKSVNSGPVTFMVET